MARNLADWITSYLEYTDDFEPPRAYNLWVALSILAAATTRQVWFQFGNTQVWPNLFVVFVGPSGCGKTQAMRKGKPFAEALGIPMSPDKSTGAKLLHRMSQAVTPAAGTRDGIIKTPFLIYAEELPSFLGDKAYSTGLLADLTTLWDNPIPAWVKSTMKDDNIAIPNPYVCLLAGSTPQGLFDTLPHNTLGQGFTSRIIFVYSDHNTRRVPMPPYTAKHQALFSRLLADLEQVQQVMGPMAMTRMAEDRWIDYYMKRIPAGERFEDDRSQGFASREPIFVLKLAQLYSISESDTREITASHVETAIDTLQVVAEQLPLVYSTMAQSPVLASYSAIMKLVDAARVGISRKVLYRKMRYRLDPIQFRLALDGLEQSGDIEKFYPEHDMTKPHYRRIK